MQTAFQNDTLFIRLDPGDRDYQRLAAQVGRMMMEAKDSSGHEHKGKGAGGGQFTAGGGDATAAEKEKPEKPKEAEPAKQTPDEAAAEDYKKNGTKARAFKEWFGASKVVDDKGEPLVVYTGQPKDLDEIPATERNELPFGHAFFTTDKSVASQYAGTHPTEISGEHSFSLGRKGKVYPVFLAIRNPMNLDSFDEDEWAKYLLPDIDVENEGYTNRQLAAAIGLDEKTEFDEESETYRHVGYETSTGAFFPRSFNLEDVIDQLWTQRSGSGDTLEQALKNSPSGKLMVMFQDAGRNLVKNKGHDGFIFNDSEMGGQTIVPFSPNQIKSVDNQGTFDPKSVKLHESKDDSDGLLEAGFSGQKKDKLGRNICYSDGKRTSCNKTEPTKKPREKKSDGAKVQAKAIKQSKAMAAKKTVSPGGAALSLAGVFGQKEPAKPKEPPKPTGLKGNAKEMTAQVGAFMATQKHLTPDQHKTYTAAFGAALDRMPPKALERVSKHLKGIEAYKDTGALTDHFLGSSKKFNGIAKENPGVKVNGAYSPSDGKLHLDGETGRHADVLGGARSNVHETYAHELAHVVDGPNHELSGHRDWQTIWKNELGAGLSEYATTSPAEGFAEFGRLVYNGKVDKNAIIKRFPRAAAFWNKNGIFR